MNLPGPLKRYQIEIAFVFALLTLAIAGLGSYRAIESAKDRVGMVRHTYQVIGVVDELIESAALVHSTARTFALTGDERYVAVNQVGMQGMERARAELQKLTTDNASQQQRLPEIGKLANQIEKRADTVISARRASGPEDAIGLLRTGEGSRTLDEFRTLATAFRDRETALLDVREQQASQAFWYTQLALALATLIALILTASAGFGTVRDIRARKKAEAELYLEKERAQVTLSSIGDGVMRADAAGTVTFLNRAGTALTGWTEEEAVGKPLEEIFTLIDGSTRSAIAHRMLGSCGTDESPPLPETTLLVRRDGLELPIEETVAPIRDKDGNFTGAVNVFRDVSQAREAVSRLRHVAHHDPLTGLPNRVLLDDRIGRALSASSRYGYKVALLYLDLDGFKLINDTRGHAVGDKLLQSVTVRVLDCVRECDTVSRIGGDEFVVLLPQVNMAEDAAIIARRILDTVSEVHTIDDLEIAVSTSIGISIYPDDAGCAKQLMANADAAMYEAKSSGRAGYVFYPAVVREGGEQRRA